MAVIGFVSEKGGVGKTTACYHIAVALQWLHEMRVLVVDTDYQRGGITCRFLPDLLENFRSGQVPGVSLWHKFQQLYSGQATTTDVDILDTEEGSRLLPADPRLSQVTIDKMPASNNIRENNRSLWRHLSLLRTAEVKTLDSVLVLDFLGEMIGEGVFTSAVLSNTDCSGAQAY